MVDPTRMKLMILYMQFLICIYFLYEVYLVSPLFLSHLF